MEFCLNSVRGSFVQSVVIVAFVIVFVQIFSVVVVVNERLSCP